MSNSPSVVLIHGLKKKPAKEVLRRRYIKYLNQGLATPVPETNIHLVYWADDVGHPSLGLDEDEYVEGFNHFQSLRFWEKPLSFFRGVWRNSAVNYFETHFQELMNRDGTVGNELTRLVSKFSKGPSRFLYRYFVEDLGKYLHGGKRDLIRAKLTGTINAIDESSDVILIAHSMGSIIALDALINEQLRQVTCLVTIGSPIGLEVIQEQVGANAIEKGMLDEKVAAWSNLYDRLDPIALDTDLADEYLKKIDDLPIDNLFIDKNGDRNRHKSYGYLNCPEMNAIIRSYQ